MGNRPWLAIKTGRHVVNVFVTENPWGENTMCDWFRMYEPLAREMSLEVSGEATEIGLERGFRVVKVYSSHPSNHRQPSKTSPAELLIVLGCGTLE